MGWKMIDGYRNPYRINDDGEVQRMTPKGEWVEIKAILSHERAHVTLRTKDGGHRKVPVVRLMDDAFLGGRAKREGLFITHKNGAKMDCALANLELVTPGENGKRHGGISNRRAVVRYDTNGRTKLYRSVADAAKENGLSRPGIWRRMSGEVLDPRGYRFERL